jgi:hypothetical protein
MPHQILGSAREISPGQTRWVGCPAHHGEVELRPPLWKGGRGKVLWFVKPYLSGGALLTLSYTGFLVKT